MSSSRFDSCNFSKEVSEDTTDTWEAIILNINPEDPKVIFKYKVFGYRKLKSSEPEVKFDGYL